MKTRKRTRLTALLLLVSFCLAFAAPVLADDADEGQDPPRSTQTSITPTSSTTEQVVLDLATGTVNLLLQVALL